MYVLVRAIFIILFFILYPYRVYGRSNLPPAPFIVCSNHFSWLDPPLVACVFNRRQQIHFMAKQELFQIPVINYIISKAGAFPVKKDTADRKAVQKALMLLKANKIIGLFPEGTRSKDGKLQELFDGVSWIALKSEVPIVPLAIKGPYRIFRPVTVHLGEAMYFKGEKNGKKYTREDLREVSMCIRGEINRLLENMNESSDKGNYG